MSTKNCLDKFLLRHMLHSMSRMSKIGALKIVDQVRWVEVIFEAMREAKGRIPDAALTLGISERQLYRWLQDEEFKDVERVPDGEPRPGNSRGRKKAQLTRIIPTRKRRVQEGMNQ